MKANTYDSTIITEINFGDKVYVTVANLMSNIVSNEAPASVENQEEVMVVEQEFAA